MFERLSRAASFALVWLLPLYALVPRFVLSGPLGTDDLIPGLVLALTAVAVAMSLGHDAYSGESWRMRSFLGNLQDELRQPALRYLAIVIVVASFAAIVDAEGAKSAAIAVMRVSGRFGLYGVLLLGASRLLSERQRHQLLLVVLAVAVFEGLFGVIAYVCKIQGPWQTGMLAYPPELIPEGGRARVQGTFGGEVPLGDTFLNRANFYSAYLSVALMVLAGLWVQRRRLLLLIGAGGAILGGILVSYSRMSLAAAFIGFLLAVVLSRRFFAAGVALTIVLLVVVASSPLRHRYFELETDRFQQWTIAVRVIAEHPVLGVGDGRYLEEATRLSAGVDVPLVRTPHNSFLYAAASYGIPAGLALLALYCAMVVDAIKRVRRRLTALAIARLAVVATFVVHDLTNNLFFVPEVALVFWAVYAATQESLPNHAVVDTDRQLRST